MGRYLAVNIWIANHYLSLDPRRGTRRHLLFAEKMADLGHRVTLVGCDQNHFRGSTILRCWEPWRRQHLADNLEILWVNSVPYSSNSYFRFLNMFLFSIVFSVAGVVSRNSRPTVMVASSGHLFTAVAGAIIAAWHRSAFVFEIRDLWPLTPIEMGWIQKRGFVARVLYGTELWLMHRADAVVGTFPGIVEYCLGLGLPGGKVSWIPNGVALDEFAVLEPPRQKDRFTLCYFGSIGKPNVVDVIVDAATRITEGERPPEVDFLIIGEGSEKTHLESVVRERCLKNVSFHDEVSRAQLRQTVENVDGFVTAIRNCPQLYRYGLSMNKLSEYMALGRPIILAGDVPCNPVKSGRCGLVVDYEDSEQMAEAALRLSRMSLDERSAMGAQGRAYAENHLDYRLIIERYCDLVLGLLDGKTSVLQNENANESPSRSTR